MENKINIAEILRDMPKGTKLYSPLFGKCELVGVNTDEYGDFIRVESFFQDGCVKKESRTFSSDGSYFGWYPNAECLLFPSAKMRDWSKFFMRGDVVLNEHSGLVAIFAGWVDDEFTEFNTTINLCKKNNFWAKRKKLVLRNVSPKSPTRSELSLSQQQRNTMTVSITLKRCM